MNIFVLIHGTSMLSSSHKIEGDVNAIVNCIMFVLCAQLHIDPIPFHMFFRVFVGVIAAVAVVVFATDCFIFIHKHWLAY